jgi:hypothetical protein
MSVWSEKKKEETKKPNTHTYTHTLNFEKVGRIELSGSRKSLKIVLNDSVFYVSIADVQKVLREPKFSATIVKVKEIS